MKGRLDNMSTVLLYFSDVDVLIVPLAKRNEFCAQGGIEPGKKIIKPVSHRMLGAEIFAAVDVSSCSEAISMNDIVWVEGKLTGIKTPRMFSKKYRNISVDIDDSYLIKEYKRNHNGDYVETKNDSVITLALSANEEELGKAVMECLELRQEIEPIAMSSFMLLNGEVMMYKAPSESFDDAGDGNTDAYQVYVWEKMPYRVFVYSLQSYKPKRYRRSMESIL